MPIKLERNKADKVHLGHRLGIFLHTILQCLWSQVVFFKERDIPSRKRGLTLCLPFERLQCLFEKSAVMVWKNQNKLIRIQFHRNMAPSTNRFQHHSKLRSIYIYIYIFIYWCIYIYIYTIVFFAIMPFFELNVDNYLEYVPSKKCIISLKRVQDSLQP